MKRIIQFTGAMVLTFSILACVSGALHKADTQTAEIPAQKAVVYSEDSISLDAAIQEAASYFSSRIPQNAKVALLPFDTPSGRLSDYIFEELWTRFEDSGNLIMVDRRNLDRIEAEIMHQLSSGRVNDEFAVSLSKQYGAEFLVYGNIASVGAEYRLSLYATDVEKASSNQRAFMLRPDNRLSSLLDVSLDDEIERAVSAMARAVGQGTIITLGRISYGDTGVVSGFSAWLKDRIIAGAQKHSDTFKIASEEESAYFTAATRGMTVEDAPSGTGAIQAVVTGNYSPLDSGAEVTLRLVSTMGNRLVLSSSRFVVPAQELERRRLSLLPEKDNLITSAAEFEAMQKAVNPYAGKGNRWEFTVSPNVLDGIYYDGAFMSLLLYSEKDCYFRIIHVDVNGNAQVIYPTSARDNNFIRAGESRRFPDTTLYRLGPPFGEEIILAAAYDAPFVSGASVSAPLSEDAITRGLSAVEIAGNNVMSPSATAKISYVILPRR